MLEDCPRCGLHFGREPGYFFGAMYFSYGIAVVVLTILLFLVHLVAPDLSDMKKTVIAWIAFWPFVPATFRYSRTFWMHFDRSFDEPTRTVLPLVEARARDD